MNKLRPKKRPFKKSYCSSCDKRHNYLGCNSENPKSKIKKLLISRGNKK